MTERRPKTEFKDETELLSSENKYRCKSCAGCKQKKYKRSYSDGADGFGSLDAHSKELALVNYNLDDVDTCVVNCNVCESKRRTGFDSTLTFSRLSDVFCKNNDCNIANLYQKGSTELIEDYNLRGVCCARKLTVTSSPSSKNFQGEIVEACPLGKCGYLADPVNAKKYSTYQLEKCPLGGYCASRVKRLPPSERMERVDAPVIRQKSQFSLDTLSIGSKGSNRSRGRKKSYKICDPKYYTGIPGGFREIAMYNCASRHGTELPHQTSYVSMLQNARVDNDYCSKPKCDKSCKRNKDPKAGKKPCGKKACKWRIPEPKVCGRRACSLKKEKKKKKLKKIKITDWDLETLQAKYKDMVVYSNKPIFGCGEEQCVLKKSTFGGKRKCMLYRYPILAVCPVCKGLSVDGETCDLDLLNDENGKIIRSIKSIFSRKK